MFLGAACGTAVTVYDIDGGTLREGRRISSANETEATCIAWNHNNRILVSSFANGLISINTLTTHEPSVCNLQEGTNADKRVNSIHLSSGSRYLISGGIDRTVRVWDLKRQVLKHAFPECTSPIQSVHFTGQSDEYIVAGCESGNIYVYHAQQGTTAGLCRDRDDLSAILGVQASPHPFVRNKLGSVQKSGAFRLWDVPTASIQSTYPRLHWAPATCLAFSPVHKNLVATGGLDKRMVFCDIGLQKEINCLESPYPISSMSLHSNGQLLATGTTTGHVLMYDLRGASKPLSIVQVSSNGEEPVQSVQFTQDKLRSQDDGSSVPSSLSMKKSKSFQMQTLQTSLINLVPSESSPSRSASIAISPSSPMPSLANTTRPLTGEPSSEMMPWLRQELQDIRQSLSEEIQMVHLEVLRQHQNHQNEFSAAMNELQQQMAQLLEENRQLRNENERLKHIH